MNAEQLLSKDTFITLFNMNELDRIAEEDKLYLIAKGLGIEKRFKETLKKYQSILKDKIALGDNLKLPKCKYDIENYNMGEYTCNINGIYENL